MVAQPRGGHPPRKDFRGHEQAEVHGRLLAGHQRGPPEGHHRAIGELGFVRVRFSLHALLQQGQTTRLRRRQQQTFLDCLQDYFNSSSQGRSARECHGHHAEGWPRQGSAPRPSCTRRCSARCEEAESL